PHSALAYTLGQSEDTSGFSRDRRACEAKRRRGDRARDPGTAPDHMATAGAWRPCGGSAEAAPTDEVGRELRRIDAMPQQAHADGVAGRGHLRARRGDQIDFKRTRLS